MISSNIVGGKRDENLILPINSSLSVTLSQDEVNLWGSIPPTLVVTGFRVSKSPL